jgi:hypothetical protein
MFQYRRYRRPNAESPDLAISTAAGPEICYMSPSRSKIKFAASIGIPMFEFNFSTMIVGG